MIDVIETVHHAVENRHLSSGDFVGPQAVAALVTEIYTDMQNNRSDKNSALPAGYMRAATQELAAELKQYGVENIEFVDKDQNNRADATDAIKISQQKSWGVPESWSVPEQSTVYLGSGAPVTKSLGEQVLDAFCDALKQVRIDFPPAPGGGCSSPDIWKKYIWQGQSAAN